MIFYRYQNFADYFPNDEKEISFINFSFLEDESSENNYPQIFNKYRTDVSLPPVNNIDNLTSMQSNKLVEDCFILQKADKGESDDFNHIDINNEKQSNKNNLISENKNNIKVNKKKMPLGRSPKSNNSFMVKHSRKSPDNASKKIIRCCIKSVHNFLQDEIIKFAKIKKLRIRKLHIPTIKKYLNEGNKEKHNFFNTSVKEIYMNTIPKRVKKEIENERDKYCHNRETLTRLLKMEEEDEEIKEKSLNMKFNAELKIYLEAFLNDKKYIIINEKFFALSDEFMTFKDYFNDGKSSYTQDEKEKFKKYIYAIITKTIQFRKKRKNH